ncbi:hypothetical protein ACFFNY_21790 [Paenibacillus hodogayensis]|uniref:Uncharacterized protein n=1 Tax=Paenibacillus hodogayensis TaxID=279208 RepID=A0ABV5W103_9BACL
MSERIELPGAGVYRRRFPEEEEGRGTPGGVDAPDEREWSGEWIVEGEGAEEDEGAGSAAVPTAADPDESDEEAPDELQDLVPKPRAESRYKQPEKCVSCVWGRWEASRQFCMMPVCVRVMAVLQQDGGEGG